MSCGSFVSIFLIQTFHSFISAIKKRNIFATFCLEDLISVLPTFKSRVQQFPRPCVIISRIRRGLLYFCIDKRSARMIERCLRLGLLYARARMCYYNWGQSGLVCDAATRTVPGGLSLDPTYTRDVYGMSVREISYSIGSRMLVRCASRAHRGRWSVTPLNAAIISNTWPRAGGFGIYYISARPRTAVDNAGRPAGWPIKALSTFRETYFWTCSAIALSVVVAAWNARSVHASGAQSPLSLSLSCVPLRRIK